jgi:hypothetical protein
MDIETIIKGALADDIYVSGFFDTNRDHRFLNKFVSEAIVKTKKQIPTYSPRMHEFAIHGAQDGGEAAWPVRDPDDVLLPFTKPDQFENWTPLIWENTDTFTWSTMERFPVPQSMSGLPRSTNNLKHAAIGRYSTALYTENPNDPVVPSYFFAFAKYDEVFHSRDFSNLAYLATASAGSEDPQWGQTAAKVADGVIDGNQATNQDLYGWDNQHEWVAGNPAQRWVQLTWPRTYKIDRINLYDRPSPWERVLSGTLSFSDGTSINVVDALPDKGGMHPVVFTPKTVSWVRFTISTFSGQKPGLAEVEVFPVNTARQATVSVSSQSPDQGGAKAIDGIRDGFPHDYKREWAANGQSVNAWIQLGFPSKTIDKIVLSDRPNNWERIQRATLTFSSGSPIVIGGLSNNGTGNVINFRPRATTFVRMTVNSALGGTTGLSEFEVYEALNSASSNYALYASTSCSSENMKTGQICKKAVDGIKDGFPGDFTKEWATESQLVGSWIQLNWPQNYPLTRIVLYDRPSSFESISGGTLTFSNGSFINVSSLPNNGSAKTINFSTKNVNWVRFTMSGAQGQNAGLSEMEAF